MTYPNRPSQARNAFLPQRVTLSNEDMREGPAHLYQSLREQYGPVVPIYLDPDGGEHGIPAWLVIGYAELAEVCTNEQVYSRDSRYWRELAEGRVKPDWWLLPQIIHRDNTRFADTPYHQPRRDALIRALNHIDLKQTRQLVETYADLLIDRFCKLGSAELIAEYARPLPLLVLARLFGLRGPSEEARLLDTIHRMLAGGKQAQRADHEITQILTQLVSDRRETPDEDVASWLIAAAPGLDDQAVRQDLWLMLNSGAGASTGLIANTLAELATDPRLSAALNSGTINLDAVLRTTKWNKPPAENVMGAFPKQDVVLAGWQIRAGDMLVLGLGGANHDPALGQGAAREAYTRSNDANFAHGAGAHRCPNPARDLGELIATVAVDRLRARCHHMALADPTKPLSWGPSFVVRALTALHVIFTPAEPGERRAEVPSASGGPSWQSPSHSSTTTTPPLTTWGSPLLPTGSTLNPETSSATSEPSTHRGRSSRWSSLIKWWRGR